MSDETDELPLWAAEVPEGQIRHTTNLPSRQARIVAVGVVAMTIGIIALALRLFTRLRILRKRLTTADCEAPYVPYQSKLEAALADTDVADFSVLAMVCGIVAFALTMKQIQHGLSYHKWDILFAQYNIWYPLFAITMTCFYTLSVGFAKLSILCFYIQLSPVTWFRSATIALMVAVAIFSVVYACINLFPCRPVQASWNYTIRDAQCLDSWAGYLALSILNIIIDITTLALPIPILLPLQITKKQKASLIAIFGAGGFVCAITVVRASIIPSIKASKDRPWDVSIDYVLAFLEINIGVVCASVPTLKPFFVRYLPALVSSRACRRSAFVSNPTYSPNTVFESNRARRMMQTDTYEMSTKGSGSRPGRYSEDEEKLWSQSSDEQGGQGPALKSRTVDSDENALCEGLHGGGATHVASVTTTDNRQVPLGRGIEVLRETTVQYEV